MTTSPLQHERSPGAHLAVRSAAIARSWWPVAAFLAPVVIAQVIWRSRYDVSGHASGHLDSATIAFPMVFVLSVLVWALPGPARRDPLLWLLAAAQLACCLVVMVGNVRVVDAIGGENWTSADVASLGPTRWGFESGHDLAARGAIGAVLVSVFAAAWVWRRRYVSPRVAVGAAVLSVVFPSWIVPGAGIVVLVVSVVIARARRLCASCHPPSGRDWARE